MNIKVYRLPKRLDKSSAKSGISKSLIDGELNEMERTCCVFNRKGMYKRGGCCWVEDGLGKAWIINTDYYFKEVNVVEFVESLTEKDISAIKVICKTKYSSKQQQQLLDSICYYEAYYSLNARFNKYSKRKAAKKRIDEMLNKGERNEHEFETTSKTSNYY